MEFKIKNKNTDNENDEYDDFLSVFHPNTIYAPSSSETESNPNQNERPNSSCSSKSASLNEYFSSQIDEFYLKNKNKFIKNAIVGEESEINNEESFKAIYRFSKRQSTKLDKRLNKAELPKFKRNLIDKQNNHLESLLEKRHLKNRHFLDPDDSDFENEEENKILIESKINFNEKLSKKLNIHCERMKQKKNILRSMYNKSLTNQEKSEKFQILNSPGRSLGIQNSECSYQSTSRPKTSPITNLKLEQPSSQYKIECIDFYDLKEVKKKKEEKINTFGKECKYSTTNDKFRISNNGLNSMIEIFRP